LEPSGVQATSRNARIDVEDVCHVVATIGLSAVPCIATKERISPQDLPGTPEGPCCTARALYVAGTGFANAQDRLWGSIGGGGTYSWANGRDAVFGEVSYNASLNDSSDNRN
jgi:hypothetical protein